jgi:homocysteine S-methyltransferase
MTVILDGGLATELEARGHDLSDRLWSARLLVTDPAAIGEVHAAYFRAGAHVATTASYQATVPGFAAAGLDRSTALAAISTSVAVARRARDEHAAAAGVDPAGLLVAGSVGPYGAMLADGSEYRGDYDPGATALRDLHAPRMETLLAAGVDLLALETIPTLREAAVLLALLDDLGATGWLSFQCRDDATTAAGEPIEAAFAVGAHAAGLVAIGVNCTAPRFLPGLLARARTATDLPLIAYPNGGDRWDATTRRWVADGDGGFEPAAVADLGTMGAGWIGGCCGTGPGDIAGLVGALAA